MSETLYLRGEGEEKGHADGVVAYYGNDDQDNVLYTRKET